MAETRFSKEERNSRGRGAERKKRDADRGCWQKIGKGGQDLIPGDVLNVW